LFESRGGQMRILVRCKSFVPALSVLALLCCDTLGAAWGATEGAVTTDMQKKAKTLQLFTYVAPTKSLSVTSTLVYGPTEAILIDTQFSMSEATALADQITSKGRKLKAI